MFLSQDFTLKKGSVGIDWNKYQNQYCFEKQYFPHHIRSVIKHEEKLEFVHCLKPKAEFAQICAETKCLVASLCSGEFFLLLFLTVKKSRRRKKINIVKISEKLIISVNSLLCKFKDYTKK